MIICTLVQKKLELGVESVASHARVRDGQPVGPGRLGAEVEATLCATRFTARPRGRSHLRDERDVVSNVIERLGRGAERVRGHVEHLRVRCGVEAWWWSVEPALPKTWWAARTMPFMVIATWRSPPCGEET